MKSKILFFYLLLIVMFLNLNCVSSPKEFAEESTGAVLIEEEADQAAEEFPEVDNAEFTQFEEFDHSNFDENSINIDNPWLPLKPGTRFIYEGVTSEGENPVAHRIIFTVTDLIKTIDGIDVVVMWDRDFSDDLLVESELTFFCQDKMGNVWHMGQYVEEYEDGIMIIGGRAWMQGHLDGAKAGIMMHAAPSLEAPSYSEGFAPAPFFWTDRAQVTAVDETVDVSAGHFENVLVIREYSKEEPGAFQLKYYAKGVGNVYVGWAGEDETQETLELIEVQMLTSEEMDEAREEALKLEERAYVYASTSPAERRAAE